MALRLRPVSSLVADLAYVENLIEVGTPVRDRFARIRAKVAIVADLYAQALTIENGLHDEVAALSSEVENTWTKAEIHAAKSVTVATKKLAAKKARQ